MHPSPNLHNTKMSIHVSLKQKIFQKRKCHSSLLWKAFQLEIKTIFHFIGTLMTNKLINYSSHNYFVVLCKVIFQTYLIILHNNIKDWIAFYQSFNCPSVPYTWSTMELKCDAILTDSCTRKPSFKKTKTSINFAKR